MASNSGSASGGTSSSSSSGGANATANTSAPSSSGTSTPRTTAGGSSGIGGSPRRTPTASNVPVRRPYTSTSSFSFGRSPTAAAALSSATPAYSMFSFGGYPTPSTSSRANRNGGVSTSTSSSSTTAAPSQSAHVPQNPTLDNQPRFSFGAAPGISYGMGPIPNAIGTGSSRLSGAHSSSGSPRPAHQAAFGYGSSPSNRPANGGLSSAVYYNPPYYAGGGPTPTRTQNSANSSSSAGVAGGVSFSPSAHASHGANDGGLLSSYSHSSSGIARFQENNAVSFTWTISELALLRDEVENSVAPFDPSLEGNSGASTGAAGGPAEGGAGGAGGAAAQGEENIVRSVSAGAGKSEIWTTQPLFGEGKWKLELVRTARKVEESSQHNKEEGDEDMVDAPKPQRRITVLSIYLTSTIIDHASPGFELPVAIMIGLKPARPAAGIQPFSTDGWLWHRFAEYTFGRERDYFECHGLPSLSELLEHPAVAKQDAVSLTVQIITGPGMMHAVPPVPSAIAGKAAPSDAEAEAQEMIPSTILFSQPNVHHVPPSILKSLEGLLDCSRTGDVRIVARERGIILNRSSNTDDRTGDDERLSDAIKEADVQSYPFGSKLHLTDDQLQQGAQVVMRDRVVWAHSSVLRARSSYFATMLDSGFSEGHELEDVAVGTGFSTTHHPERRFTTLRIFDADFATVYWLIRFLYVGEVNFVEDEDVKEAATEEGGWCANHDSPTGDYSSNMFLSHWTSADQVFAMQAQHTSGMRDEHDASAVFHSGSDHGIASLGHGSFEGSQQHPRQISWSSKRSASGAAAGAHEISGPSASTSMIQPEGSQEDQVTAAHAQENSTDVDGVDTHAHPCDKAPPASALAMYKLSHRYGQTSLNQLCARHLIASLTPSNAFAILLATSLYPEVHAGVQEFVYDRWADVSATDEFEQCCDEVSAGEWGSEAGRSLRNFMRSLVSPAVSLGRGSAGRFWPPGALGLGR